MTGAAAMGGLVADHVAATLRRAGIRFAFGMPGGEVVALVDALERSGIRFVLARNETAAAIMAAGTSTIGGAPGLLVTTLGPGLANAVNGIADAWQERVPLLVLSGVVDHAQRGRYTHQVVDHRALLAPLVKGSFEIEAEGAGATVERALRLAMSAPAGPVHLDLSPAVAAAPATAPSDATLPVASASPMPRFDPQDPVIATVRERFLAARRPLVLAGLDAVREGAGPALARLADRGVPVLTTYKAKGILDERHPSSLGAAGLSPLADRILQEAMTQADCILLAGYDPVEMRQGWLDPFPHAAFVAELGGHGSHAMHRASLRLDGPAGPLLEAVAAEESPSGWPPGALSTVRQDLASAFRAPSGWGPHAVFETLAEHAPDATLTLDSGAHRILLSQMWQARRPLTVLQSTGWCTMGAAIPLAVGASLADPDRRVVAVLGDGGLEMTLGELGTVRDQALPLTILVLQDHSLALIALKQQAAGLAAAGVALGATDYTAIACAFGGR
jgi:acetolactate synthase-1/2/3 large subunit